MHYVEPAFIWAHSLGMATLIYTTFEEYTIVMYLLHFVPTAAIVDSLLISVCMSSTVGAVL